MTYRLTPLKGSGWHRLGLLSAVAFVPVTAMLWSVDAFGGGTVGISSAAIFYVSALVLSLLLAFGTGWAMRGFAVRTHGDGEGEEHGAAHHREASPAHPPATHAAPAKGHAAAGHR